MKVIIEYKNYTDEYDNYLPKLDIIEGGTDEELFDKLIKKLLPYLTTHPINSIDIHVVDEPETKNVKAKLIDALVNNDDKLKNSILGH